MNEYNLSVIRKLMLASLSHDDLVEICYDEFPEAYCSDTPLHKRPKVQLLLEYCDKQGVLSQLLKLIQDRYPQKFAQFEPQLRTPSVPTPINPDSQLVDTTAVLTDDFSHLPQERLALAARAAQGAIAAVLDLEPDQIRNLYYEIGSLVLHMQMPQAAADHMLALFEKNDPVIAELGLVDFQVGLPSDVLGMVSTAIASEASQNEFYFWIDDRRLVEATQLVRVSMPLPLADPRVRALHREELTVVGVVEEVRRQSESRSLGSDYTRYGGQTEQRPLLPPSGFTYAHCRVLDLDPMLFIPLKEGVQVYLASETEAGRGYGYPAMEAANSDLVVGLLRNGGSAVTGAAKLDTRYILGEYGGHVNVTGVAGTATKTSFLMVLTKMLVLHAQAVTQQQSANPLFVVPIVFNVKGNDLMWLNQPNRQFDPAAEQWQPYRDVWGDEQFAKFATPFKDATFYSFGVDGGMKRGLSNGVKKYSWGLQDVIEWGAERYLFSEESRSSELLQGVLDDAFYHISTPSPNSFSGRTLDRSKKVTSFVDLVDWLNKAANEGAESHYLLHRQHSPMTIKATVRRLNNMLSTARGILVKDAATGEPPQVTYDGTRDPIVIDIDGLESAPQRFVVAAVIERIKRHRETHSDRRQRYLVVLDELNRFAPRGSQDEVSKLFEHVAAQLRSQGVILFGAQQKASGIAPLVWENAATKVLGRTGAVELANPMWRQILPEAARSRAAALQLDEKMILQDVFNYPMLTNIPLTPWATRHDEVGSPPTTPSNNDQPLSDGSSENTPPTLPRLNFEDE